MNKKWCSIITLPEPSYKYNLHSTDCFERWKLLSSLQYFISFTSSAHFLSPLWCDPPLHYFLKSITFLSMSQNMFCFRLSSKIKLASLQHYSWKNSREFKLSFNMYLMTHQVGNYQHNIFLSLLKWFFKKVIPLSFYKLKASFLTLSSKKWSFIF